MSRHAMMRTTIIEYDGLPTHKVFGNDKSLHVPFVIDSRVHLDDAELVNAVTEVTNKPFDLATGPLYRGTLHTKVPGEEYVILVCAHHIIFTFK